MRPARVELQTDQPVVKRGVLTVKDKQGEWRTRWCVLQGATFASFVKRTDESPQKVLPMQDLQVEGFREPKRPFGIRVTTPSGRQYSLAAETRMDQKDWIERMQDIAAHGLKSNYLLPGRSLRTRTQTHSAPNIRGRAASRPSPAAAPTLDRGSDPLAAKKKSHLSPRRVDSLESEEEAEDELYEQHRCRLEQGGFDRAEFKRNSGMILQVLSLEDSLERSSKRLSKVGPPEISESISPSSGSIEPLKPPPSNVSKHFVGRRGSLQFERRHLTLREMCKTGDVSKKFRKMVKIGEGSFGTVYVALTSDTKVKVAVKKMNITKKNRYHIETELELHRASSSHPNVVKILESYIVQDSKHYEVWAVLEFLENGALTESLTALDMKEAEIAYVCREVVAGLSWLHSRNLVHRDVKSDNVLLGGGGEVKLGDFGLAIELVKGAEKRRSVLGTPFWMSPEVINGKDYDDRVDIWALGVTTIEMMNKKPPYSTYPKTKALFLITSQGIPLSHFDGMMQWSDDLRDWLAKCLTYDANRRPNVWTLADHALLANACSKEHFIQKVIAPMKGKIKQCTLM